MPGLIDACGLKFRVQGGHHATHGQNVHPDGRAAARQQGEPQRRAEGNHNRLILNVLQPLLGAQAHLAGQQVHGAGIGLNQSHLAAGILGHLHELVIGHALPDDLVRSLIERRDRQRQGAGIGQGQHDLGQIPLQTPSHQAQHHADDQQTEKNPSFFSSGGRHFIPSFVVILMAWLRSGRSLCYKVLWVIIPGGINSSGALEAP